jgi:hypothetical protein
MRSGYVKGQPNQGETELVVGKARHARVRRPSGWDILKVGTTLIRAPDVARQALAVGISGRSRSTSSWFSEDAPDVRCSRQRFTGRRFPGLRASAPYALKQLPPSTRVSP